MGFKKFRKRLMNKAKSLVKKPLSMVKGLTGSKDSGGSEDDARSEAAAKQIRNVSRQAGSGQIEYQTEE